MFSDPWSAAVAFFLGVVVLSIVACHVMPGPLKPGSSEIIKGHAIMGVITGFAGYVALNFMPGSDPYPFATLYSGALMVLCVECWYTENPKLFNGSLTRGWPFFLFHRPGEQKTMAVIPMKSYTRVFSAWHAGGVCLSFFMHVLGGDFPSSQKAQVSLAVGLLWIIWASTNYVRFIYGGAQFCQIGIAFHSLVGPGCGLNGYWHLWFWWTQRGSGPLANSENILLGVFVSLTAIALVTAALGGHQEAPADEKGPQQQALL
jgi:hypothetical protein